MTKAEEYVRKENFRLRRENATLKDLLKSTSEEVCFKCSYPKDPLLKENCTMCRYRFMKEGKMPP